MKKLYWLILIPLIILVSCHPKVKREPPRMSFGIYEIIKPKYVPDSIKAKLQNSGFQAEEDTQSFILGYLPRYDTSGLQMKNMSPVLKLVRTVFPVDSARSKVAVVAVRLPPDINNTDIQITANMGDMVEIHFNMAGAQKWADFTARNRGKNIAMVINDDVYLMPLVTREIKSGVAVLNGLDERTAAKLSTLLNSTLAK